MENKLTPELIEKARQTKSVEELLSLAKENEIELSELEAKAYFEQMNKSGELSDDELDNVAGGGCYKGKRLVVSALHFCDEWACKKCGQGCVVTSMYPYMSYGHTCSDGKETGGIKLICDRCKHCTYEGGLWLCNNPNKMK
ncbi:MAG: hypothetical protein K2N06_06020 [Oscillospiraceae bacterium]|nr:hypothetical protein [Oscillospiraceae bacterium]